ncbi:TonB-dependent receptor [Teredinibacter turnerae]|uniref:TonB-dependent receptor n=1 Tax=Teredinibacter turnerae TaxID=2426 RepID=UPI000371AC80|nr:TonB-dependent receptor [Teredinibacter turnerae]
MKPYAITPLAAAVAMSISTLSLAEEQALEEVYVTGFKASLKNSLATKQQANGVVDAIYAEDIADFPDNNLAESLQRIPGVAVSRAGGEGRQITVRGLGPAFTRVRINGMEAMSSTGGTDAVGGNNRGRSFDFNTFSSDLFSNLIVRKTNSGEVEEGSLGATVDLRTARPMDFDGFTLSVSAQAGYNDKSEEIDPKLSVLVSHHLTDTFGALFSVSYADRKIIDEGNSTVRWSNAEDFGSYQGDPNAAELEYLNGDDAPFHPRIPRYDSYTHNITRTGAALSLQWQPATNTEFVLDTLYSEHDASRREVFMQGVGNSTSTVANYDVRDYIVEGNTLVYADIANGAVQAEDRYDELNTTFNQITLHANHEFNDRLRINGLIGTAESEFKNPIQNTFIGRANGVGFSWDYRGESDDVMLTFGDDAYTESAWELTGIRQRPQGTNNSFSNAAVDIEFDINAVFTIKGGISTKSFEFDSYQSRLSSENNHGVTIDGYLTSYDSGLGDGRAWLIPDRKALLADYPILDDTGEWELIPRQPDTFGVTEDTTSAFVQLDFATSLNDMPFSGDIGLRKFNTSQSSTGWYDVNGDGDKEQIWVDHSYDDLLPSANFRLEAMENVVLRFSASEGIARAGLQSLKADQAVRVDGSARAITGGNPLLEPTKATSYDAGIELYLSDTAAMTLTVFKKEIDSHVQSLKDQRTPAELGIPDEEVVSQCEQAGQVTADCNSSLLFDRTVPLNGPGGDLHGFEWGFQTTFGAFGEFWENVGIIANYTYVKTQVAYLDSDGNIDVIADLTNLSDVTSSATLYYEDTHFSARLALVERSDYLTDPRGRNGNIQHGTYGTSNLDFSAAYTLNDNFKLTFDAVNLTNEADDQWVDVNDKRLSYYHETGTQVYLGAQYKF